MTTNGMRLSIKEKVGYSFGDLASNLFFQTFVMFLMYFYTDIYGISAVAVSTMFLITRIWDAVNDPLMGAIADRTNTRWGKFRPYLIWCAIPFGILGVLTFTTPDLGATGKVIYAYTTYTLLMMIYTAINVPYSALMGVITSNPMERTVVSSYRFVAAFVGGLVVQGSVMWLVRTIGGENEALGWQGAMIIISSIAVALFFMTFATTKERVQPPPKQKTQFKQDLADLFGNFPWLIIGATSVLQLIFVAIRNGSIMYYFKYFIKEQAINFFGNVYHFEFGTFATAFMVSGTIITILGTMTTKWFTKKFDKRKSYLGFLSLQALFLLPYFFLGPEHLGLIFGLNVVVSFVGGPLAALQWSIFTDTADYSEWKFKRRATGLIMSASLFAIKLGLALGGALLALFLDLFGFIPNVAQTMTALTGIKLCMSLFPALATAGCIAFMWFYPLTNKKMETMEAELKQRREQVP